MPDTTAPGPAPTGPDLQLTHISQLRQLLLIFHAEAQADPQGAGLADGSSTHRIGLLQLARRSHFIIYTWAKAPPKPLAIKPGGHETFAGTCFVRPLTGLHWGSQGRAKKDTAVLFALNLVPGVSCLSPKPD